MAQSQAACEEMLPAMFPRVARERLLQGIGDALYDMALAVEICVCREELVVCGVQSRQAAATWFRCSHGHRYIIRSKPLLSRRLADVAYSIDAKPVLPHGHAPRRRSTV